MNLPPPDTHCFDDDTGKDVWSYSPELVHTLLAASNTAALDALKDMVAEFRALDLPYGSKAYAKAISVLNQNWRATMKLDQPPPILLENTP